MLNVYTRHLKGCEHNDNLHWRRCRCPKWIRGLPLNGEKIRHAAQTTCWENAEKLARKLEAQRGVARLYVCLRQAGSRACGGRTWI